MNFIDLFCGAGGLSEGFIQAGFTPIAHVEVDKRACETLETRLIYHKLKREGKIHDYYDYISKKVIRKEFLETFGSLEISDSILNIAIGGKNNRIIFDKIDKLAQENKIDLIIGGPPCQAYSLVGRARDKEGMENDPRNFLYKEYGKFLKKYKPKVFVFENVLGLITAKKGDYFKNMQSYFKRIGYELDYTIQKSEDFGVLQKRRRIILIGWQKGSHFKYPTFTKTKESFTIKDIFSDLKKLKPGEQKPVTKYAGITTDYLTQFALRNGVDFVTQHITRPHNDRDLKIYEIAINKWLKKSERLKYPDLPTELKTHKNEKSFVDRYKVVDLNGLSHTMVAHIAKDGHHYIYPDSNQVRSLSVREAARIQSFPDDFFFEGGRSAAFKQIGNAVPPLMSKEIANAIKKQIMQSKKLVLKFDPNTIEHLGVSLYSQLPSVLSELVSNSWDADANNVSIDFIDTKSEKEITYSDDGEGMTHEELNEKYLVIGRNRRNETQQQVSKKGRKVIGKKGLGKLSVFGICDRIEVISVKNGLKNHFVMDLLEIKSSKKTPYFPKIITYDKPTQENTGTILKLKKIRRKSKFDLSKIALSLSKKFLIFDEMKTSLFSDEKGEIVITNDLKFKNLNIQFEWKFPNKKYDETYQYWNDVRGTIFTLETPVKDTEMRGLYLTSRGKIVNTASFYEARDNDQFHSYVTGYLEVDFIDNFNEDVISTDRLSLNWENEKTKELKKYLHKIIKKVGYEWRAKRREAKSLAIKKGTGLNVEVWQNRLPTYEKELSFNIINPILESSYIDIEESSSLIGNVINKFENQTFKEYASRIADVSKPEDIPMLLKLMDEWKTIESKEIKSLAYARIEVIKQFERYLNTNTKEVPTLHNFFKQFPWLLDPRILEFRDEVTYSKLLKDEFPEAKLDEVDRRIDFLCSNALGEILYVIEIKRSQFKVNYDALEQAYDYQSFLKDKYASSTAFSKVICYVIGGEKSDARKFRSKEKTYMKTGEVFVKTYRELLEQSKEYHKEFIDAYDKYNKNPKL